MGSSLFLAIVCLFVVVTIYLDEVERFLNEEDRKKRDQQRLEALIRERYQRAKELDEAAKSRLARLEVDQDEERADLGRWEAEAEAMIAERAEREAA